MSPIIPPAVEPPFVWRAFEGGPGLVCAALEPYAAHCFTTRAWTLGAQPGVIEDGEPWRDIAQALSVSAARLVRLRQVHGARAIVADALRPLETADIILTGEPSLAIAVQAADCVPILLADTRTGAVAAAHAGWRGMAAHAPAAAVRAMSAEFGTRPSDLVVALGPSIGSCCYEVGADVRAAFLTAGFDADVISPWFSSAASASSGNPPMRAFGARADRWFFDGWRSVRDQLTAAGVGADRVFSTGLCTASHPDLFCSYRRDGAPAGRLAAAIRSRPRS